jgi:peroxiredoxin
MNKIICLILLLSSSIIASAQETIMSPMKPIEQASEFTLPTPEGKSISLKDYRGKYLLVNFWAYWCSPCIKELPDMQKLYDQMDKENFEIIGIHAGPYNEQAAELIKHFKINFPIVSDTETSLKEWDVPALPMTYLINPEGEIIFKAIGPREWNLKDMKTLIASYKDSFSK